MTLKTGVKPLISVSVRLSCYFDENCGSIYIFKTVTRRTKISTFKAAAPIIKTTNEAT